MGQAPWARVQPPLHQKKIKNQPINVPIIKRTYQGRNIWDDPIIEKSQDQDQGQGQGQDHLLPQRAALPQLIWSWP